MTKNENSKTKKLKSNESEHPRVANRKEFPGLIRLGHDKFS